MPEIPSIYDYADARHYLRDVINFKKSTVRGFSYQQLAQKLGLKSKGYVYRVINSEKQSISSELQKKLSQYFKHSEAEERYYKELLVLSELDDSAQKARQLEFLNTLRPIQTRRLYSENELKYFSHWYIPVVREALDLPQGPRNATALVEWIRPEISLDQAEEALEVLQQLGLIHQEKLDWMISNNTLEIHPDIRSPLVRDYHRQMLQQAEIALDRCSPDEREVSAMTFTVPKEKVANIKSRINELYHEIVAGIENSDLNDNEVYQLNVQLFPFLQDKK